MSRQIRYQLVLPSWLKDTLVQLSDRKEVSTAEFIKDILKNYVDGLETESGDDNSEILRAKGKLELERREQKLRDKATEELRTKRIIKKVTVAVLKELSQEDGEDHDEK
ncbi:MAG: hypothetical protein V3U75_07500 [Methylococcaceae bacterium]